MLQKDFSHVPNFTGYMGVILRVVQVGPRRQRILDIPAGNGLLADRLRACGHEVVRADINRERPDYVYADLNEPLPFRDAEFDTCICAEGIEHVLAPPALIHELCRATRPGGRVILSLPNIQNAYSRLNFFCKGYFFQFTPADGRHLRAEQRLDRGHISPVGYLQLRYLFEHNGARLVSLHGDRWKKKWLVPFLLPFLAAGWFWARMELRGERGAARAECREKMRHLYSPAALLSRPLILCFARG
jgi:SAM-dependent methyltransferase